jgi:hypothetical protein
MILLGSGTVESREPSNRARDLVQASLAAESQGLERERRFLLEQAINENPDEPSLRWRLGQVREGREWKTFDSVASEWSRSKALAMYDRLREQSPRTLISHLELAAFCEARGLTNEAIAHQMAVLAIDPNHEPTRRKLGFTLFQGRWYLWDDLKEMWARQQRIERSLQRESRRLTRIAIQLQNQQMSIDEASEQLLGDAHVDVIPAWEAYLSSSNSTAAMAVVQTLTTMSQPESTLSLARHACWVDDPTVRCAAIQALRERNEYSYIPAMLSELQGPWTSSTPMILSEGNRLIFRYVASSERHDKNQVRVFDNAYSIVGDVASASQIATQANGLASLQSEYSRSQINTAIDQRNRQIIQALQQVTGESGITSPQDWWNWWDERIEVFSPGEKPWETTFGFRSSTVEGESFAIPIESVGVITRPSISRETIDCLAAGTLVLTNRGPMAIESIRLGDSVWAKNLETGEVRLQPVIRTTVREPSPLVRITCVNEQGFETVIRASGGHPFFVNGRGWVRARELKSGMTLHGLEGVSWVQSAEREEEMTETYNLVVHEYHSYFVGPSGILSHDNSIVTPAVTTVPGFEIAAK